MLNSEHQWKIQIKQSILMVKQILGWKENGDKSNIFEQWYCFLLKQKNYAVDIDDLDSESEPISKN